jgi:hypothetical protein
MMMTSCKVHDPAKCPLIKLVNNPIKSNVFAAQISCGFQKMCLVEYDGATNTKTCKEHK